MDKKKSIENAVDRLSGKFPDGGDYLYLLRSGDYVSGNDFGQSFPCICTREEFSAAVKRLGYINGYKFGVEYPTNGRQPDLPDDTMVATCKYMHQRVDETNWRMTTNFKITDQRYKPADEVSEVEKLGIMPPMNKSERCIIVPAPTKPWFEAGELPKAGTKCMCYFDDGRECWHKCIFIGSIDSEMANGYLAVSLIGKHELKLVWANSFAPIKTDKEKAIQAADAVIRKTSSAVDDVALNALYDAGLLRLPEEK
jgi:hypothetical protein